MDASILNAGNDQSRLKVSLTTRLVAALVYTIPAIGGALSSILLMNVLRALRANENAGVSALMGAMKQASLPAIVSLYLAAICGIAVIIVLVVRMIVQTKTASPPFWFFAIGGILCLLPAGLFWKAHLLIIEVLSPGSSISGGGIAGVGAEISRLLLMSVIAAPVVIIVLLVASVLPFSSRSRPKWGSLMAAAAIEIMIIAVAIAIPFLIDGPKRKNEIVSLPVNVKSADHDYDLEKDTSMVVTLTSDNKLYQRQTRDLADRAERTEAIITKEELLEKINRSMEGKTPDKRIVYFKCDVNASYENVLQVFDVIRKADIDKVGLVVVGGKNEDDPYLIAPLSLKVYLAGPIDKAVVLKPNPLTLIAILGKDGRLLLNNEDMGTVLDPKKLEDRLRGIFKERENNGVFREGTNEIEKTVFLKVSKSSKYGDFIKLVETVKSAGVDPIGIQIDDVN
jgi:biopolymer transport protein ExbD